MIKYYRAIDESHDEFIFYMEGAQILCFYNKLSEILKNNFKFTK